MPASATSPGRPNRSPENRQKVESQAGRFFIQRHNATRLHYDFRLEIDGTLKSWAIPKGPSLDPSVKHLAAMVEDHPLDYGDFEGNIPKGEYGGGSVMLWDRGTFELIGDGGRRAEQIARGDLKFRLHGEKLNGTWAIVHMKNRGKGNEWLIIKKKDEAAQTPWDIEDFAYSVKTGRTQEEIAADLPAHKKAAAKKKVIGANPEKLAGAVRAPMPGFFEPMGATLTDQLPKGAEWIFEVKWDGVRGLTFIDNGSLTIYTRNNNRCERQYPELQVLPALHRRGAGHSGRRDCGSRQQRSVALRAHTAPDSLAGCEFHRENGAEEPGAFVCFRSALSRWLRSSPRAADRKEAAAAEDRKAVSAAARLRSFRKLPVRICWKRRARADSKA